MSSSNSATRTRAQNAISLLLLLTSPTLSSSQSSTSSPTDSTVQCQLISESSSLCQDLAGRNSTYAYPSAASPVAISNLVVETVVTILSNEGVSDACIDLYTHLTCLAETPCNPETNLPLLICEDSCALFQQVQASGLCRQVDEIALSFKMGESSETINAHFSFDCTNSSTYIPVHRPADPNICTNLFSPEIEVFFLSALREFNSSTMVTNISSAPRLLFLLLAALLIPLFLVLGTFAFFIARCISKKRNVSSLVASAEHALSYVQMSALPKNKGYNGSLTAIHPYYKQLRRLSIPSVALEVGEIIGQGSFAKVFKGKYCGKEVAVKTLNDMPSKSSVENFFTEGVIMKNFHHPNVLGLVGVVFDTLDGVPYLVVPLMKNGNLRDYLRSQRVEDTNFDTLPQDLQLSSIIKMCIDISRGMEYLAGNRFVHRDLAARNCMVDEDLVVKIGDFGLARDVYITDYYRVGNKSVRLPVKWMAPETFNDNISTEKTDVWSFGVTCWEVFSLGRTPYPAIQNSDIFSYISSGKRLQKPPLCPHQVFTLIETCWEHKPKNRPNFTQLAEILEGYWEQECSL